MVSDEALHPRLSRWKNTHTHMAGHCHERICDFDDNRPLAVLGESAPPARASLAASTLIGEAYCLTSASVMPSKAGLRGSGTPLPLLAHRDKCRRAYLSTQAADAKPAVNSRDRIGNGPWQNFTTFPTRR